MGRGMELLSEHRLLPLVTIDDTKRAAELAEFLVVVGLPIVEVTLRTEHALSCIASMAKTRDLCVGAGTVRNLAMAQRAVEAGAEFLVSPGLLTDVAQWCTERGIDYLPGVLTPTEILAAQALGLRVLKFFPARAYGGTAALCALQGPFADVELVPTGGVAQDNLAEYLALENVRAVGGGFLLPEAAVDRGDFDALTLAIRAAQAVALR